MKNLKIKFQGKVNFIKHCTIYTYYVAQNVKNYDIA